MSAWSNFADSIKSPQTRTCYVGCLQRYMQHHGMSPEDMLSLDRAGIHQKVIDFIVSRKNAGIRAKTIGITISALWHFYTYNDMTDINWVRLRSYCGEHVKAVKDRAYTVAEIRAMLKHCDNRKKVALLLMVACGLRIGAIPSLKIRNFERLAGGVGRLVIYEGAKEEYFTFCTPECTAAIDEYLEYRKRAGEELKADSPLIREQFNHNHFDSDRPRPITRSTLQTWLREMLIVAGVRKEGHDRRVRHTVMVNHGLRKFYNTQMIKAGVKPVVKEILIGHKAIGLESNYFRPTEEELLAEYLKAVDLLTISTEDKLQRENAELEKKLIGEEAMKKRLEELNAKFDNEIKNKGG